MPKSKLANFVRSFYYKEPSDLDKTMDLIMSEGSNNVVVGRTYKPKVCAMYPLFAHLLEHKKDGIILITDCKGELFDKYAQKLFDAGYTVYKYTFYNYKSIKECNAEDKFHNWFLTLPKDRSVIVFAAYTYNMDDDGHFMKEMVKTITNFTIDMNYVFGSVEDNASKAHYHVIIDDIFAFSDTEYHTMLYDMLLKSNSQAIFTIFDISIIRAYPLFDTGKINILYCVDALQDPYFEDLADKFEIAEEERYSFGKYKMFVFGHDRRLLVPKYE